MYILHIPSWFPDEQNPYTGNFIEKHIEAISKYSPSVTLKVVRKQQFDSSRLIEKKEDNTLFARFYKPKKTLFGRFFSKIYRHYLYRKSAKEILREYGKPSLIHLHVAFPMGGFARKLSRKWNVPLLLTEHWSIYQPQNQDKRTPQLMKDLAKLFDSVSAFTAVSENLKEQIALLFPGLKSTVIPNVVDTELFFPRHSIHEKKTIIHISTLQDEVKNISGILNAIAVLYQSRQDFVLKIIHENRSERAEEFVKANGLEELVLFMGSKTEKEVADELQKSDFLLLFSNYENLPCVIIEAFACGKPVLATAVGGIAEIVNEERGILIQPKDEKALVEQLNKMLDHVEEYDSEKIRKYAEAHFTPEIVGKQFADFYEDIVLSQ